MNIDAQIEALDVAQKQNARAQLNLDPAEFARLEANQLSIVLVYLVTEPKEPLCFHPEIANGLGLELEQAGFGRMDVSNVIGPNSFTFFHVTDLGKSIGLLKRQLEIRGLLSIARVLHRETGTAWRCYWSQDKSEIAQLVEDDNE